MIRHVAYQCVLVLTSASPCATHEPSTSSGLHNKFWLMNAHPHPCVKLPCGPVNGLWEINGTVAAFRGLKYGASPEGTRRWQPSEAAACWKGPAPFQATRDGFACMQESHLSRYESEDCLSLNVFAPAGTGAAFHKHESPLPVMVFIPGGGNVVGSASS